MLTCSALSSRHKTRVSRNNLTSSCCRFNGSLICVEMPRPPPYSTLEIRCSAYPEVYRASPPLHQAASWTNPRHSDVRQSDSEHHRPRSPPLDHATARTNLGHGTLSHVNEFTTYMRIESAIWGTKVFHGPRHIFKLDFRRCLAKVTRHPVLQEQKRSIKNESRPLETFPNSTKPRITKGSPTSFMHLCNSRCGFW